MLSFALGIIFTHRSIAAIALKEKSYMTFAILSGISLGIGIMMFAMILMK